MRHSEIIYLLGQSETQDEYGNIENTYAERKVYANKFDVGMNEFYEASTDGFNPSISFVIHTFEYKNERRLKHNNVAYQIIRTSERGEKTTLICEVVQGGN